MACCLSIGGVYRRHRDFRPGQPSFEILAVFVAPSRAASLGSRCRRDDLGARAIGGDRGRPQPAGQACRAGTHRARLGGSSIGAAGGAERRRQPADGVALATALCRERGRGSIARQDPQTRQSAVGGRNHGAGGGVDVHRAAAPGDALDRPGDGQGHRHFGGFRAAHLAGAQTAAAPAAHLQALARSQLCHQAD